MKKPIDNVFTYFASNAEKIFRIDKKKLDSLVEIYNKNGGNTSLKKFSEITGFPLQTGEADVYRFTLCAIANDFKLHKKQTEHKLMQSKLSPNIKTSIKDFFSKLNENGLRGLYIQFHISGNLLDDFSLLGLSDVKGLREIRDDNDVLICYLPATRIKFTFDDGEEKNEFATFSQDRLAELISTLQAIYDQSVESIQKYKNDIKGSAPVIG